MLSKSFLVVEVEILEYKNSWPAKQEVVFQNSFLAARCGQYNWVLTTEELAELAAVDSQLAEMTQEKLPMSLVHHSLPRWDAFVDSGSSLKPQQDQAKGAWFCINRILHTSVLWMLSLVFYENSVSTLFEALVLALLAAAIQLTFCLTCALLLPVMLAFLFSILI